MFQDCFKITQLDVIHSQRREMPPPTQAYRVKKKYDRRDKSWRKEVQDVISERSYA